MTTLIKENLPKRFWHLVKKAKCESYFLKPGNPEEFRSRVIIVRTNTNLDKRTILRYPELELIIRAGSGYDNIDVSFAQKNMIKICTTPEANTLAAYEHTLSFILALIKQHRLMQKSVLAGKWKQDLKPNWEFSDLKVLIVGVGRIGTRIAKILLQLGSLVKGVDPYLNKEDWDRKGIEPVSYEEGLSWCNLISFHCPLTTETRNYFNQSTLEHLDHSIWLLNIARGGIVSEPALFKGLQTGKIKGAALDVYISEPVKKGAYSEYDNLYLSPHSGSMTENAKERLAKETFKVWYEYVFNKNLINEIDYRFQ